MPDITPVTTPLATATCQPPPREKVLCISAAAWERARPTSGSDSGRGTATTITPPSSACYPASLIDLPSLLMGSRFDYRDRVEDNVEVRQVVPVCLLTFDGKILCYQRQGSEGRLLSRYSVLVGGHVNHHDRRACADNLDPSPMQVVRKGLEREMIQELGFDPLRRDAGPAWVLADDSDPVGRVHLGLCYLVNLPSSPILSALEGELAGARWVAPEIVGAFRNESWTDLILRVAFPDAFEAIDDPPNSPPIGAHAATDDDGADEGAE